jgi:hypothetical protein
MPDKIHFDLGFMKGRPSSILDFLSSVDMSLDLIFYFNQFLLKKFLGFHWITWPNALNIFMQNLFFISIIHRSSLNLVIDFMVPEFWLVCLLQFVSSIFTDAVSWVEGAFMSYRHILPDF